MLCRLCGKEASVFNPLIPYIEDLSFLHLWPFVDSSFKISFLQPSKKIHLACCLYHQEVFLASAVWYPKMGDCAAFAFQKSKTEGYKYIQPCASCDEITSEYKIKCSQK